MSIIVFLLGSICGLVAGVILDMVREQKRTEAEVLDELAQAIIDGRQLS